MALATIGDLQAVMRREIAPDTVRAQRLLEMASTTVGNYTGVTALATTTIRLKVRNGKARLPLRPVTAVTEVKDMSGNAVPHEWYLGQVVDCSPVLLNEFEINLARCRPSFVDVTYTHGYAVIPEDIIAVICDMVAAALGTPPEDAGVQQETLGPWSVTTGQSSGGLKFTQAMRDRLADYRAVGGTIQVAT